MVIQYVTQVWGVRKTKTVKHHDISLEYILTNLKYKDCCIYWDNIVIDLKCDWMDVKFDQYSCLKAQSLHNDAHSYFHTHSHRNKLI